MQETPDVQLLCAYVEGDEAAFREIVSRHTDLVYSAALRQINSPDQAQDIAQGVFVDLVRKAREVGERLAPNASLAGWLYRSTRFAVLNRLRDDHRRAKHERQAMEQLITDSSPAPDWERIRPILDEAMAELSDDDRDAVVLRYFKNYDFQTVGRAIGLTDDAAQKRVSRAVERLREFFSKRGVATGASALVILISANAVQSAPLALATAISTAVVLAGTTAHTSTAIVATKVIAMTTLQKAVIGATLFVAVGTVVFEVHRASRLREEYQILEQQKNSLAKQAGQMQRERDDAKAELASVSAENARLKSGQNLAELLKLRGEVGVLRDQSTTADSNSVPANAMAKLMDSSTSKELSRVKIHELLKYRYAPLLAQLNLSTDEGEKFYNLIIDNEIKKKGLLAQLLRGDTDVDSALQARDTTKADLESQISALLGITGHAQYGAYNHTADAAEAVKRLNNQLGPLALSPDQIQRLQATLAKEDLNLNIDDMDLFRSKEALDGIYQSIVERAHQDLEQASSILTSEQLAAAATIQSNLLQTIRNTITLGQQLVTDTAKQHSR
jgi:RNA polymerase sigma factor (sigma-70 family)